MSPVIIQNYRTHKILMLGYMNEEAYQKTLDTVYVWFFSRSRKCLWQKGETSGNTLQVVEIRKDCDEDTYLISVIPQGVTCHTGEESCFDRGLMRRFEGFSDPNSLLTLEALTGRIQKRIDEDASDSLSVQMLREGRQRILQKVGEEAVEVILAGTQSDDDAFLSECADLMYFCTLMLLERGMKWEDVMMRL